MADIACPACGAELRFRSRSAVFTVCSYCSSMIVRHDLDIESLGKMADLPPDMSPLQIGTRGRYKGKGFELVGRQKIHWENGTWNEWYALFDDGSDGWLAEAQGFYSMSFVVEDTRNIPPRKEIAPGRSIKLANPFEVSDIKEATCVGSEGELPFQGPKGRTSVSVDLVGSDNRFACIDYSQDGIRLYVGSYVEFDDLKLTSLREIDGW